MFRPRWVSASLLSAVLFASACGPDTADSTPTAEDASPPIPDASTDDADPGARMPLTAIDDLVSGLEDVPLQIQVLANDSGLEGRAVTLSVVQPPTRGHAVVNEDGTITYAPAPNSYGADAYQYQLVDDEGRSSRAFVYLKLTGGDDGAPVAEDDEIGSAVNVVVVADVLANDSQLLDAPIRLELVRLPEIGTAEVDEDRIRFSPPQNAGGVATVTYRLVDADGDWSEAVLTITVAYPQAPPPYKPPGPPTDAPSDGPT